MLLGFSFGIVQTGFFFLGKMLGDYAEWECLRQYTQSFNISWPAGIYFYFWNLTILFSFSGCWIFEFVWLLILIFTLFSCKVLCSTWKDDGTTVFSGGCDKQVKMWPLLSGGQPMTVAMHDAPIKDIAWIPEMSLLVTGSWDKTLK